MPAFILMKKQVEQRGKFLKAIIECEQYVASQGFKLRKEFDDFFNGSKPLLIPYFSVRNDDEIVKALSLTGMFVILTNTGLREPEVLQLYREKDGGEKSFDLLKHTLVLRPLRVHSQSALEGLLFMDFISLILYS